MPTLLSGETLTQTEIHPVHEDYRELPIREGFDFDRIIQNVQDVRGNLAGRALYLVVFRSQQSPDADPTEIEAADDAAYEEASQSPELLSYFRGSVDQLSKRALSMCLWTSAKAAFEAVHGPDHQSAASRAPEFYGDNYSIEFYSIVPSDDGLLFIEHKHPQTHNPKENN